MITKNNQNYRSQPIEKNDNNRDKTSKYIKSFSRSLLALGILTTIIAILAVSIDTFVYAAVIFALAWGVYKQQSWAWFWGQIVFGLIVISSVIFFMVDILSIQEASISVLIPIVVLGYFIRGRYIEKNSQKSIGALLVVILAFVYIIGGTVWTVYTEISENTIYQPLDTEESTVPSSEVLTGYKGESNNKEDDNVSDQVTQSDSTQFHFNDLEEGMMINGLELVHLGYHTEEENGVGAPSIPYSEQNFYVVFSGQIELQGTFEYFEEGSVEYVMGPVCFYPDNESAEQLPRLYEDNSISFCFRNSEKAKDVFGPEGNKGTALVVVDQYKYTRLPAMGTSYATLVDVL